MAKLGASSSHTPPIFDTNIRDWQASLVGTLGLLDLLLLTVLVPAIIMLVRRQSRSDVRVLALFGISILAFAAIIQNKAVFYAILIAPTVPLVIAPYVDSITQRIGKATEWAFWRNLIVLSTLAIIACINLAPAIRGSDAEFRQAEAFLQEKIPTGSLVYGSATYWFALHDTRYVNWDQFINQQRAMPGGKFSDAVQALKPDYIVIDGFVAAFLTDDDQCYAKFRTDVCIPKAEFNNLMKEHATVAGTLSTQDYGNVILYKMNWADAKSGAAR
jgi:hypothetical protein